MEQTIEQGSKTGFDRLRLWGLQSKLIVPYVLLTLIMAAVGIYVITRLVTSQFRERFVNQLNDAARVAADAVVRQERENLENLRQIVFTQGVPEAMAALDADQLETYLLPLAANDKLDAVTVVDAQGIELLTLGRVPQDGTYTRTHGTDLSSVEMVQKVLSGVIDERGDKYVGLLDTVHGKGLFIGMAVTYPSNQIMGAILVGKYLDDMVTEINEQAMANIVLFDQNRDILATTLVEPEQGFGVLAGLSRSLSEVEMAETHDLTQNGLDYQITYIPFEPRQQQLGWLGVLLPSSYVVATEATSRNVFSAVFAVGTLAIILIGSIISQSIAHPILKLRSLTQAVASGNLDQESGLERSDEIGELAVAFDQMTLNLRERTNEAARLYAEAIHRNQELAETNARLRETQSQLIQSEKMGAIGQLAAGIVHDIKNPLTVVKGVSELMLTDDNFPEDFRQEASLIFESSSKAIKIVSDLMKFARQSELEMDRYDLRESIETALRLAAFPIRKAHVKVIKDLPGEPVNVVYDNRQIEQVFLNLVHNAVQAMPSGGTLLVNLSKTNGVAAVAIQDTGTGIPAEIMNRIFDPFFTTKPEGEGTGLGLSVSYGIVSHHNGRIDVQSEVGKGTTFTVILPVEHLELEREKP